MRYFICCILALAALSNMAALVVAPEPPQYADGEASVVCELPASNADVIANYTLQIEALNALTNQFEVWFCTDKTASPECCNFVVGVDCGKAFVRGLYLDSEKQGQAELNAGCVAITSSFQVSSAGKVRQFALKFNGTRDPTIDLACNALLPSIKPRDWHSIKVVSRGLFTDLPAVTFDKTNVGFVIRICQS